MTTFKNVSFVADFLCGAGDGDTYCHFEGDVTYTLTLRGGEPFGTADTVCPECSREASDESLPEFYLDYLA